MEQAHATHKDTAWGWFAALLGLLDGFPRRRDRPFPSRNPPTQGTERLCA